MKITAIIMNGRHGGETFCIEYQPTIKMQIEEQSQISLGEQDNLFIGDFVEYKECFRAVDGKTVLYSEKGSSAEIRSLQRMFKKTYPVNIFEL